MIKYTLDTNICRLPIKNKPQVVREAFNRHHGQLCISAITLMELIYGAEKSAAPEKNLAVIEGFAARLEIFPFDNDAAAHTGMIRSELAKAGPNDRRPRSFTRFHRDHKQYSGIRASIRFAR